jgi:CO/xanthine dehydrogenase Mo-binding subunit
MPVAAAAAVAARKARRAVRLVLTREDDMRTNGGQPLGSVEGVRIIRFEEAGGWGVGLLH